MLEANADPNQTDTHGHTPISHTCNNGDFHTTFQLLEAGAETNIAEQTENGETPLMHACDGGYKDIVELLIAAVKTGAEAAQHADAVPPSSASDVAAASSRHRRNRRRNRRSSSSVADIHTRAKDGGDALLLAAGCGHLEIVQLLAAYGASRQTALFVDPWEQDHNHDDGITGNDARGEAADNGHQHVVDWLDAVDGWTPLQIAAALRNPAAFKSLLRAGSADPFTCSHRNGDGGSTGASASSMAWTAHGELLSAALEVPAWSTPRGGAVCSATTEVVRRALAPWTPSNHKLYHNGFKLAVMTMLLLHRRLATRRFQWLLLAADETGVEEGEEAEVEEASAPNAGRISEEVEDDELAPVSDNEPFQLPLVINRKVRQPPAHELMMAVPPIEIWFVALGILMRSDWPTTTLPSA